MAEADSWLDDLVNGVDYVQSFFGESEAEARARGIAEANARTAADEPRKQQLREEAALRQRVTDAMVDPDAPAPEPTRKPEKANVRMTKGLREAGVLEKDEEFSW